MICPKCKGKKGYLIGPNVSTDWRLCTECSGTGYAKIDLGVAKKMQYPLMKDMLEAIDELAVKGRLTALVPVVEAMYRGVPVIPDARMQEGKYAILVSPLDFERLKQECKNNATDDHGEHLPPSTQQPNVETTGT